MTDQNLTDLLEWSASRTHVGPPPLEQMLARARHVRRRRAMLIVTAASAAVVAVVVGTAVTLAPGGAPTHRAGPAGAPVSPSPTPGSTTSPGQTGAATSLDGTWKVRALVGRGGQSVMTPAYANKMELTLHDGRMTGTTGCNSIFGTYTQSGDRNVRFPRSSLGSTQVGCPGEPPLVARLLDVRHVSGSGNVRYLHAANWMIVVMLRAAPVTSTPGPSAGAGLGIVRGRMLYTGGPAPGHARAATPGTVTLQGPSTVQVPVDRRGRFHVSVAGGTYHLTGHSPEYGHGKYLCRAPHAVTVDPANTSHVQVYCQLK